MSFGHHTPESLLPRSDSKNPATTCKGITQNGRPCRRPLSTSPNSSPAPSPSRSYGVLAVLQDDVGHHSNAAAFYCWQHQDQADQLQTTDPARTRLYPLKEKSSIDTLVDRLGVLDIDEDAQRKHGQRKHGHKRRKPDGHTLKKRDTMPTGWQHMQSPLMTVPEGFERPGHISKLRTRTKTTHGRSNLKASFLCCLREDDDHLPPARRPQDRKRPQASRYQQPQAMSYPNHTAHLSSQHGTLVSNNQPPSTNHRKPVEGHPPSTRPSPSQPNSSPSPLSLIPPTLPPVTMAALLTELSRPLTPTDLTTSGYIYIFWLTPSSDDNAPDSDIASTILDDADASPGRGTVQEQMLQRYSSKSRHHSTGSRTLHINSNHRQQEKRTILLKLGRAVNVHRRMTQWQKQCGHNITLLRYYPNVEPNNPPRSPDPSSGQAPPPTPTPAPLLPRVERLIHIELAALRTKQEKCGVCGREHREWFEVDASKEGVRAVNEVVARWVGGGGNVGGLGMGDGDGRGGEGGGYY
jgi:hypothetical protein